ncbi:unnamed protein product (macronuclear) [Paramecium tetraurelia]|uniref:Uncharacterized protein n=1 Tax=Paramecium tetraurelia TaxID=5888 RepID=A0DXT6_PARTE|nr:uncharacterized protein GSPATT00021477001 [Paramecium tetraurelia]CAK87853.1 unnamed protein product [Paramecium tetraurelia]|eukprot:XP_001455250.1 hypothetical protein (macronuclear) [Paramecium tetraurelia strain d4-2]
MSQDSWYYDSSAPCFDFLLKQEFNIETRVSDGEVIVDGEAKIQNETKNIPKNIGVLLKNYLKKNHQKELQYNLAIKKFIQKGNSRKNYTRKDFKTLLQNSEAKKICSEYFCSFQIIDDLLKSKKIGNMEIVLKYIKKLFLATHDPEILSTLKYPKH